MPMARLEKRTELREIWKETVVAYFEIFGELDDETKTLQLK